MWNKMDAFKIWCSRTTPLEIPIFQTNLLCKVKFWSVQTVTHWQMLHSRKKQTPHTNMCIKSWKYFFRYLQRCSLIFYYMYICYSDFFPSLLFRFKKESEQLRKQLSDAEQNQRYIKNLKMTPILYKTFFFNSKSYSLHVYW